MLCKQKEMETIEVFFETRVLIFVTAADGNMLLHF